MTVLTVFQCEDELTRTNTASLSMTCTASWWYALDDSEQIKRSNAFKCVANIEDVIAAQAVGALHAQSSDKEDKEDAKGGADAQDKKSK